MPPKETLKQPVTPNLSRDGRPYRRVQRKTSRLWKDLPFEALRSGDVFRMFDGDKPVVAEDGSSVWQAVNDPDTCPGDLQNFIIDCVPFPVKAAV